METEASAARSGRPRPWLLVALGLAVALALMSWLAPGKSAAPAPLPSKPRAAKARTVETVQPSDLDVRLETLKQPRPGTQSTERNPFRFYVPPAPPPPVAPTGERGGRFGGPVTPLTPPPPVGPPPIPLKYIGWMDVPKVGKVAAFSDCRATMRAREGEIVAGQYRLVRIQVESVVMEYVDGQGRTTIRMSGQECVGK
jgi:hypothetical protein